MKLEGQRWNGTRCVPRTDRFRPRSMQSRDKPLLIGTVWHSRPRRVFWAPLIKRTLTGIGPEARATSANGT